MVLIDLYIRLGAPSQKTSPLGGVAQTLIYPSPSSSLTDMGLFFRTMLYKSLSNKELASLGLPVVTAAHPLTVFPCSTRPWPGSGPFLWIFHTFGPKSGMALIPLIRLGAQSQKTSLLGGVDQTLLYTRPSPSRCVTICSHYTQHCGLLTLKAYSI